MKWVMVFRRVVRPVPAKPGRLHDGMLWWGNEPPPDWELPFEPPYDHPAAAFPGESGETERTDEEVPPDAR